ncbi:MAG TPA: leucyl aminopeptidase [Vicinamibacterales bacterium]|nr:leucyl aminopeptidase [Vicinamibacterales bacterium]
MFRVFRTSPAVPQRLEHRTGTANGPIDVELQTTAAERIHTGVLVVGAFADGTMPPVSDRIDKASKRKLSSVITQGDLDKKAGSTVLLHGLPGIEADRVLLVSLGLRAEYGEKAFRDAIEGTAKRLADGAATSAAVTLTDIDLPGRSLAWRLQQATWLLADGAYHFDAPRTNGALASRGVREIALLVGKTTHELEGAVQRGHAIAEGVALARDLGNLPGNVCNPPYLAETARALGREFGFHVEVLDREAMRALGMGAALAVGQASEQPCKFIVMQYKGSGARPIVLVGKGVTFDTGGISLKPGAKLDEMKFDMCGAASVLGVIKTIARLALPINLVGIIPAAENMPGGKASRPGDVVTSMSGQTIEILNTDAEGRLGLCDALTYAERFDPACVVDVATLTGACVIALGAVASGLMANDDSLASELLKCGDETGDRAWQLPVWDEYQDLLKSNFADMSNLGGPPAGAVTAACFLARFAKNYKWAHLDIAGTNAVSGDAKGATGRPVPLLSEFLIRRAGNVQPQSGA